MARGSGEAKLGVGSGCTAAPAEGLQGSARGHPGSQAASTPDLSKGRPVEGGELGCEAEAGEGAQRKRARRQQLLSLAPQLPWGQHLDYWGAAASDVPVNPGA